MIAYIIRDKKGYKHLSKRVKKGKKYLEDKWLNSRYKKQVEYYNAMACAMLEWEIDSDIFESKFNKWLKGVKT